MNIKWNLNAGGINNSWNRIGLVNRQSLVTKLFGTKCSKGTTNIISQNADGDTYTKGMSVMAAKSSSASKGTTKASSSAEAVLAEIDKLNDAGGIVYEIREDEDLFILTTGDDSSVSCSFKQLQKLLNYDNPKTMEVDGNTITFENNCYYKFTDSSGKEHKVLSMGGHLTEGLGSDYDEAESEYMDFWNCMASKNTTLVSRSFSNAEVRDTLGNLGIQTGFYTINVGGRTQTQYLSQGQNASALHDKEQYDERYYYHIQSGNLTKDYVAGAVIKIGGVEYTVDENGKIPDVPYGADIYDIEYPGKEWNKYFQSEG